MSFSIVRINDKPNNANLMEYVMDSADDLQLLPTNAADGSMAYTRDLSRQFMLKDNVWAAAGGQGGNRTLPIHICVEGEYDSQTGKPTITNPDENVFYLVPTGDTTGDDQFKAWVYSEGRWESWESMSVEIPQSDWNQTNTAATDYIKNKPAIKAGTGNSSVIENSASTASGDYSHAEGYSSNDHGALGNSDHSEGYQTKADSSNGNTLSGTYGAHAEGNSTQALNNGSHAEGAGTTASGNYSHAEGAGTKASGNTSHAEGAGTTASGNTSHAEGGMGTTASGDYSHAEGAGTTASGNYSHAEGSGTTASGINSHAEGSGTKASGADQHVFGHYNINDVSSATPPVALNTYAEIVGNGSNANARSNARTLDWSGNEWLAGNLTAAGGSITIGSTTITEAQLQALLALLNT